MGFTTAVWRIEGQVPRPISRTTMDLEARLEDLIVADPDLLGPDALLVIDRQVHTSHGKYLDVLAVDQEGTLHAVELKRDRTPRDVAAQALDYGWWIRSLTIDEVSSIWEDRSIDDDRSPDFATAFAEHFDTPLETEAFNADHRLTIVAASLDPGTERIIEYLADDYGVPINAVLFSYFTDEGREYLTRTWMRSPVEDDTKSAPKRPGRGQKRPWNGRDVFVPIGRAEDGADGRWHACLKFGFVSAGGGAPYWKFLRNLEPGLRVFGYVAGAGYVGVGDVTGPLIPLRDLVVASEQGEARFIDLPDCPPRHRERALIDDPDMTEYAVPVEWTSRLSVDSAIWQKGMFANQLPCRLKDSSTIDRVEVALGLREEATGFADLDPAARLEAISDELRAIFEEIEGRADEAGLERSDLRWWVNFVATDGKPVVSVVIRKGSLKLYTDHGLAEFEALGCDARDVSTIGHHGSGNTEITISSMDDLKALQLILDARSVN